VAANGRSGVRSSLILGALALLAVAGCGHGEKTTSTSATTAPTTAPTATTTAATPAGDGPQLSFADDRTTDLGFVDHGVIERKGSVVVHDIEFRSGTDPIQAYLVEPIATGRVPGVVLVHGSGGDRSELLPEAIKLAQRGAVTLTITAPSTSDPLPAPTNVAQLLAGSTETTVRDVVAVRRAADVLASRPTVDPKRIGYLGWSAGAKTGTFVAAADPRFRALALLSAGADTVSAFVAAAPPGDRRIAQRALSSIDPIRYVALARPGTLLLEDGTNDEVIPHGALENVIHAAPRGTLVRWYPTGHALSPAAYSDAFAWLLKKLRG
jgi:dienelactone hydrolase